MGNVMTPSAVAFGSCRRTILRPARLESLRLIDLKACSRLSPWQLSGILREEVLEFKGSISAR